MSNCKWQILKAISIELVGTELQITVVPFSPIDSKNYVLCIDGIPMPDDVPPLVNPNIVIVNGTGGAVYNIYRCSDTHFLSYTDIFKGNCRLRPVQILLTFGRGETDRFLARRVLKCNCNPFDGYIPTPAAPVAPEI